MRFIISNPSLTCDSTMENGSSTTYLHIEDLKELIDKIPCIVKNGGVYIEEEDLRKAILNNIS